jgi:hypothetical protein
MKIEEIEKFVLTITKANQRTILTFLDNKTIVGFFEGNTNQELTNQNFWNFVPTPNDGSNHAVKINGDTILKIEIINMY